MISRQDVLQKILKKIEKHNIAVEVGVQRGWFSGEILKEWNGTLILVDSWRKFPEDDYQDEANVDSHEHHKNLIQTKRAVEKFQQSENPRVILIDALSVQAADFFPPQSLDWVYLDANHNYKSVAGDLRAWTPKIRHGGLIWGDDYLNGIHFNSKFDVKRAVQDFADLKGLEVQTNEKETNHIPQWWIQL